MLSEKTLNFALESVNWTEYTDPECRAAVRLSVQGDSLTLLWDVTESDVRAVCAQDFENVWEDSCVEFFVAIGDDPNYYNIECNCTGKMYMCYGSGRENRTRVPQAVLDSIPRRSSLGREPFTLKSGPLSWGLEMSLPLSAFAFHKIESFEGLRVMANFYKCGNALPHKHFLSWAEILTPRPDFHRPEYFKEIVL